LLVQAEGSQGKGDDAESGREMGKDTELGDEFGVRKEENRETTQGQVIEKVQIFVEALRLFRINVVITRNNHSIL
jgi:hypothetical protein